MTQKRIRCGRGRLPQIRITCFLVTEPDQLPSEDESQWYYFITNNLPQVSPCLCPYAASPALHPPATNTASFHHHQTHLSGSATTIPLSSPVPPWSQSHNIPIDICSYFHSTEVHNVFGYYKSKIEEDANKDVRDVIYERILSFQKGAFTYHGWRDIMEDGDK